MDVTQLHLALDPFISKGGLFDTGNNPLEKNIGKRVCYKADRTPTCINDLATFRIVATQYDYKRKLCYRIVNEGFEDTFGSVGDPDDLVFIGEEDTAARTYAVDGERVNASRWLSDYMLNNRRSESYIVNGRLSDDYRRIYHLNVGETMRFGEEHEHIITRLS